MLIPASSKVANTDFFILQSFRDNSKRYCAKKRNVSSTDIPKAIPNTNKVEGFKGIPKKPINPAVINKGNKFGIIETKTILNERNIIMTNPPVRKKANNKEESKLFSKYLVPFWKTEAIPVMITSYLGEGNILLTLFYKTKP